MDTHHSHGLCLLADTIVASSSTNCAVTGARERLKENPLPMVRQYATYVVLQRPYCGNARAGIAFLGR